MIPISITRTGNREMIGFWAEMKDKYSYAADHPWLAVAARSTQPVSLDSYRSGAREDFPSSLFD